MNVFIVPSWYPSASNLIYGTFNYEQARLMSQFRPDWQIGVSTWGQGDDQYLIYARKPSSWLKLLKAKDVDQIVRVSDNLSEYFSPAFSWTRKILAGNLDQIKIANESNLKTHIRLAGKPDVISVQASYPGAVIGQHLSQKFDIPYTVTIRMSPFPFLEFQSKNQLLPLVATPLLAANKIIATSKSLQNRLQAFDLISEVVNNPVDTDFFRPKIQKGEAGAIFLVGRLENQKGIDLFLKAYASIDCQMPVRIGGAGSLSESLKDLAESLGIAQHIHWLGALNREEVRDEMQMCAFFVLPSRHETFGNVVVEALACGKPVVATRCGGPEEIVSEEIGILCEVTTDSLASALEKMRIEWPAFESSAIRAQTEKRYAPEKWLTNLEATFRSVL